MKLLHALALAGLAIAFALPVAVAQAGGEASAKAVGYAALLPAGTQGAVVAESDVSGERTATVTGLRPTGGGAIGSVTVRVGASTDGLVGRASGSVVVSDASLLDGRVAIGTLRMAATTDSGGEPGQVGLTEGSVAGLVVDGRPVAAGPGTRVDVAGIGTLVFLEQVSDGAGGVRANGVRVEVTDATAASVIGQPFVLGHLDLTAVAGTEPATPDAASAPAPRTTPTAPPLRAAVAPDEQPPPATAPAALIPPTVLGLPRRPAPSVSIASDGGYVFPVVGDVSFTDDYGAPRAGTGWHHGNDVFAPTGTPLVAVADGTLSRVGINTLGGNRLWLTDDAGNEFYYAHLSAYAPAAVEGAHVSAGQVIGFVGNTGQAITTPPHLHFEVHPGGGDSVDPYPYLIAWQRGTDIPRAYAQAAISASPAPAVGAVLVDGTPEIDTGPPPADGLATPAT